jgi:hypothetical protein
MCAFPRRISVKEISKTGADAKVIALVSNAQMQIMAIPILPWYARWYAMASEAPIKSRKLAKPTPGQMRSRYKNFELI